MLVSDSGSLLNQLSIYASYLPKPNSKGKKKPQAPVPVMLNSISYPCFTKPMHAHMQISQSYPEAHHSSSKTDQKDFVDYYD